MSEIKRVKIDSLIESQIPEFLLEESPLFVDFLRQYYKSLEHQSGTIDLALNINKYKNSSKFTPTNLVTKTTLTEDILTYDDTISVVSTDGWPNTYGLLKIDDEIITYTSKTNNSFKGCIRGFSGIDTLESFENSEFLNFSETSAEEHTAQSIVQNLSNLFLLKFYENFKYEFFLGFENRDFDENISVENVLLNARNFYISKGTNSSYKFLFKVLYGSDIDVINPNDYTLKPSSDTFFITKNLLVEQISGENPVNTKGNFLIQQIGETTASGSIFNIEFRPVAGKSLYEISLDSSSISGTFQASGQTKILEEVPVGSNNILVDSTVGFAQSGKILVKPENSDFIEISYLNKTSNQLLGVSGVTKVLKFGLPLTENKFAFSYVGFGNTSKVEFRVINVIENVNVEKTNNLRLGDRLKLSSFGKNLLDNVKFNAWIYNIPTQHDIQVSEQVDTNKFRFTLYDKISTYKQESIFVYDKNSNYVEASILDINYELSDPIKKYSNQILVQLLQTSINVNEIKYIQKRIYKANHNINYFPEISKYPAGVQNTYLSKDKKCFYVTSSGLPNYTLYVTDDKRTVATFNQPNRPALLQGLTSSFYVPSHNYVNGNLVYYKTNNFSISGISTGYYYVTVIDNNNIKLSFSKSDIFSKKYLEVKSGISSDTIVISGYENKLLEHQKIFKKFPFTPEPSVVDDFNKRSTNNRQVGLFVNGVEALSATYFDENIFYGPLDSIDVTNRGSGYDVVDPPTIEINDSKGTGAKAHVNLSGKVEKIKIISPGIGYEKKPKINIFGGNGTGCALEANLVKSRLAFGFKSEINVDSFSNSISFLTNISFEDGEEVLYDSNTNLDVPGLVNGSSYFVGIINQNTVKLYNSKENALRKVNEIDIVGVSSGFHFFNSLKSKNTITEIYVKDPGQGYSNRKIKVPSILSSDNKTVGINTFDSYIFAPNHGFSDVELVTYSTTNVAISGLNTSFYYYVKVLDDNKFKLSFAGPGISSLTTTDYVNAKYIKFNSLGIGTHTIGYPPITITVESISALGSTSIIAPILKPIVLGQIDDVYIENPGVSYGCTDIINFHRRPDVGISSIKSTASLLPIVNNGKIVDVKITNPGNGYRIDSDIIITGDGDFAKIEPIISDKGKLIQVNIIDGGVGYGVSNTILKLENRGRGARFLPTIKKWKVNQVVKLENYINTNDDAILLDSKNYNLGLQVCSYFVPKKLRYQVSDNYTILNQETSGSLRHSPIIGYAYDGNPIYGPYGYSKSDGGSIKQIQTSFALNPVLNPDIRPPGFVPGYFVDDYTYEASGDLDEHNGRFCVTPEFPDGTYAYFYSVDIDISKVAKPKYPYLVGPSFNNLPIEENFLPVYNQDYDLFTNEITRNVGPYYLNSATSRYELIDSVSENYKQEFEITKLSSGTIKDVSIFSPGTDYKVNDLIILDNQGTGGTGANIVVSKIKGQTVKNISITSKSNSNVIIIPKLDTVEAIFNEPHELSNLEPVVISGVSSVSALGLEGLRDITVQDKTTRLIENIPTQAVTGISTFIKVNDISGFSSNDIIGIGTEKLLITRISKERSGFFVNRIINTGVHTAGIDDVVLFPKKLTFKTTPISGIYIPNEIVFFDPKESVGTGSLGVTRTVVGLGTTSFQSRFIPTRSIYLPEHKFYTGQPLTYNVGVGGTSLYVNVVGSAVSFQIYNNQTVYAVNLGRDYIGLSTVGFTTSSGIGTNLTSVEFWDLNQAFGVVGSAHSLTTQYKNLTATVKRVSGIITTVNDHGLSVNDEIELKIKSSLTETYKVFFDNINRKILINEFTFTNANVSIDQNLIQNSTFENLKNATKVVYFAQNPLGGLVNGKTYFLLKKDINKIAFCEYEADVYNSKEIDLTSVSAGGSQSIKLINPQIILYNGSIISFDVSDSSLLDMRLDFYSDSNFTRKIEVIGLFNEGFAISRSGNAGQQNSKVDLNTNKTNFPKVLYYKLNAISPLDQTKNQISADKEVPSFNKINIIDHQLNTRLKIDFVNNNKTFSFNSSKKLTDVEIQILPTSIISYTTKSKTALGPIEDIKINFGGRGYLKTPTIKTIASNAGKNGVLKLISDDIGKVEIIERIKDGFDYPTDPTLSAQLSALLVCGIKDIRTIDKIEIINSGKKYNTAPVLFVKNGGKIELRSNISGGSVVSVDIIKNSTSLSSPLEIIPIYNSNGYEIDTFNTSSGNDVTIELFNTPLSYPLVNSGYGSTQSVFPFSVGDEIFIEKCSLTPETKALANFNSSSYDFKFFTVTAVNIPNNTITYSMAGIATGSFGTYNDDRRGFVINKKDMASFQMILKDDVNYLSGEKVSTQQFSGNILENGWDNKLNQMRIGNIAGELRIGDSITGDNSKTTGIVEYLNAFEFDSTLSATRDSKNITNTFGLLNDFQQRISDNFYYQKFSYSLRTDVPYSTWKESVRSIVHPSGFQEFSDYILYTKPTSYEVSSGIAKSTNMKPNLLGSSSNLLFNIDSEMDFVSRKNYFLVYEDDPYEDGSTDKIFFNEGVALKPFILNETNKVLRIDDISSQFTGTTESYIRGRYADASDLLELNREFIQEEVVAFVEFNYPNIISSPTYDAEKCKRDTGFIVDAIIHDLKYDANNRSVEAGLAYWNAGSSYITNEIEQTLFAYNYVKFIGQYIINNQTPPTLYQNSVPQQFNFDVIQDVLNYDASRYKDARNLILLNKREIQDRSLSAVAVGFPTGFYFPGDSQTNSRSRYYRAYQLIQINRTEIIDTAWAATLAAYPLIAPTETKCKRDLGYFVDAISTDIFTGGNRYARLFILQYFANGILIPNGIAAQQAESKYAFVQARDLMRSAVRNGLTLKNLNSTPGPAIYAAATPIIGITSTAACTDVQISITTLVGIVTSIITIGSTSSLPIENPGSYNAGGLKCFRDLGYIIDGVAQDISYGTNQHTLYNTKKYFNGAGVAITNGLVGEESQSILVFETAKSFMKQAVTNQLYGKDLTITADPLTGFNTSPNSCINVQTNINTLVGILTVAIGSSSLAGIPTENYGTTDCADVRTSLGNYIGIITSIIGLGPALAPPLTYAPLTLGGGIVGLTTFKLKNKGTSLFKHVFNSASGDVISVSNNTLTIFNHNYQTGQELEYNFSDGSPIGIATTSYVGSGSTILMQVYNLNGTAILENGYSVSITTSITGVGTVLVPAGPISKSYVQVIGLTTTGSTAEFTVFRSYSSTTGQPLSTSISPTKGGSGYSVGQTVSIAGTYLGGTTPANNLTFVISKTGPTGIQTRANEIYLNVPSNDASGATFNVSRNSSGYVSIVDVVKGGVGYATTSVVSIAGTYLGGSVNDYVSFSPLVLGSNKLPKTVFVYKLNDNQFGLLGLSTSPAFLNITQLGVGSHSLSLKNTNASVIIAIDNVVQPPISRSKLSISLGSTVSTSTTTIIPIVSGITSVLVGDVIKLDDEYLEIKSILANQNSLNVDRGVFGSVAGIHTVGTSGTIFKGKFNIVGDTIFFASAPYGLTGPVGIQTRSSFSGRIFSRQFDGSEPRDKNIILDDISGSFTGIAATQFTIKSDGNSTVTLFNDVNDSTNISNNPLIFINGVFQSPVIDFTIEDSNENKINFISGAPSAGKISAVSISTSHGYQPRLVASATAVVSASGTVSSVIVNNGGKGYRKSPSVSLASTIGYGASLVALVGTSGTTLGIITSITVVTPGIGYAITSPPTVLIGIPTGYSNLGLAYTGGTSGTGQQSKITVEVGSGSSIISFKFDDPGIGYKVGDKLKVVGIPTNNVRNDILTINNVLYDNVTGVTTIRTLQSHLLKVGDSIRLSGIALTCGYDEVGIRTFSYDNVTGVSTIVTYSPHGLLKTDVPNNETSDEVFLYNLPFNCPSYTTNAAVNISNIVYNHIAGIATITTSSNHGAVAGKQVKLAGIAFSCAAHSATGIATYNITNFVYTNSTGITTITLNANHGLIPGEYVQLSDIILSCPSEAIGYSTTKFPYSAGIGTLGNSYPKSSPNTLGGTFNVFRVLVGTSGTTIVFYAGISTVAHTYSSGGKATVGITSTIFPYPGSSPTAVSGTFDVFKVNSVLSNTQFTIIAGVSSIAHTYVSGGTAQSGVTTTIFPDGTSTYGKVFPVLTSLGSTSFTINSGISTIPHTFVGWPEIGITTFKYTNTTGIATATTSTNHNYLIGDKVTLENLSLTCPGYVQNPIVNITNLVYDKVSGIATITTANNHLAITGKQIKLAGIALTCPGYVQNPIVNITNLVYDKVSGIATITTASNHLAATGKQIKLAGIALTCPSGSGITSTIFPYPGSSPNTLSNWDIFKVDSVLNATQFTINVGVSSITHTYVSGGTAQAGITSTIFPQPGSSKNTLSNWDIFKVNSVLSQTQFTINVGVSTIAHTYVSGGTAQAGITSTIFPYPGSSIYGYTFTVIGITTNTFTFNAGISTIVHDYVSGGKTKKAATVQRVLRYTDDSSDGAYNFIVSGIPTTVGLGSTNIFTVNSGVTTIPHYYTQSGIVSFRQLEEFTLTVDSVETSSFSGVYPGQFIVFNDISSAFNGFRKKFTLSAVINGVTQIINLRTPAGTDLDITNNIFVFLNDILQDPTYAYTFSGSRLIFSEAPIPSSKCVILYYRGSSVDVTEITPPKTLKEGDGVVIQESANDIYDIEQFERIIKSIPSSDQIETFVYSSIGINTDVNAFRPLTWKKQKQDRIISGSLFSKSRPSIQSNIVPTATIIKKILPSDDVIYVDNAFPLFSDLDELNENLRNILITEDKLVLSATGQATVSGASTVSSIIVTNPGVGYANTLSPKVRISSSAIKKKDPIYDWKYVNLSGITTLSQFNALSYGNQLVAVGNSSLYSYSFDSQLWITGNVGVGSTVNLKSVEKVSIGSSDIILTVGSKAKIAQSIGYSSTLTSWTEIPCTEEVALAGVGVVGYNPTTYTGTFNSIVSGNNGWVVVGTGGSIFTSSGIITSKFISRYSGVTQNLNSVVFGNNYYVAVGNNGILISSNTGNSWELNSDGVALTNYTKVIFDGDKFIAVGNNAVILKSINRTVYQSIPNNISSAENIINIKYFNGIYIAITSVNKLYYSFDLSTWTYRDTLQSNQLTDALFVNNLGFDGTFVAVGAAATIITSTPVFHRATAESVVTNGQVSAINVIDGGFGYLSSNIPSVIIEPDTFKKELIKSFKVVGDYGNIIGITTFLPGTPGIGGTTAPKIEFRLKSETYDNTTLGIGYSAPNTFGITASQLQKGDYFVISQSNVQTDGSLIGISTQLGGLSNYPNSKIGIATNFLDGVYIVDNITTPFSGIVTVTCHFYPDSGISVSVSDRGTYNASNLSFSGINTNNFYGRYSWSKFYDFQNRSLSLTGGKSFDVYTDTGLTGLSTSPKVIRTRPNLSN